MSDRTQVVVVIIVHAIKAAPLRQPLSLEESKVLAETILNTLTLNGFSLVREAKTGA